MAKASEIRDLPVMEIETKLDETQEELFNLRFQNATGQLDNYKRLRQLRKDVARIKTILRERELTEHQTEGTSKNAGPPTTMKRPEGTAKEEGTSKEEGKA